MKKYIYSVNNGITTGLFTVEANNKKEAIEKAKKFHCFGGVNVSSFRVKK